MIGVINMCFFCIGAGVANAPSRYKWLDFLFLFLFCVFFWKECGAKCATHKFVCAFAGCQLLEALHFAFGFGGVCCCIVRIASAFVYVANVTEVQAVSWAVVSCLWVNVIYQ